MALSKRNKSRKNPNINNESTNNNTNANNKANTPPNKRRVSRANEASLHKVSSIEVITEELLNKMTKGGLDQQESSFEIGFNKIYSNKVKMVIQLMSLPTNVSYGYFEQIKSIVRAQCGNATPKDLDLISIQYCKYERVTFGKKVRDSEGSLNKSLQMLKQEKYLKLNPDKSYSASIQRMAEYDPRLRSSMESQVATREELYIIDKQIEETQRKLRSFNTIEQYQRDGGTCMNVYNFIEIVASTQDLAMNATDVLKELLEAEKFIVREVTDLQAYQEAFAPTSMKTITKKGKNQFAGLPYFTLSNTIPMVQNFRPGILRTPDPEVYMGTNIENNYRVDVNLSNSDTDENYLVIGNASSGKSLYLKTALLTWMDNPDNCIIIKEYKGGGWDKFMGLFPNISKKININIDESTFVNTYNIPDATKFKFTDPTTNYTLSQNITLKILLALLTGNEPPTPTQKNICDAIVTKVFLNAGVDKNVPATYPMSNHINFLNDTWTAITQILGDKDFQQIYNLENLNNVKTGLSPYFHPDGKRRNVFGKELILDDVIFNSKIVIFDYAVQTASSSDNSLENELITRILQENFIEKLYCIFNREQNYHTVVVTEELDEQMKNPYLYSEIYNLWKTSASLNVINFATVKNVETILTKDESEALNITGFIIGNTNQNTLSVLQEKTDLKRLGETLPNICSNPALNRCFLIYHKYHRLPTAIVKMNLTKDIILSLEPLKSNILNF